MAYQSLFSGTTTPPKTTGYKPLFSGSPSQPSIPQALTDQRTKGLAAFGIKSTTPPQMTAPPTLGGRGLGVEFTPSHRITDASKALARDIPQAFKNAMRGGSFEETMKEIDHIAPVSLGGTGSDFNLQALSSPKGLTDTATRQEGKLAVELENITKFQKGEITQGEAIYNILQYQWGKERFKEAKAETPSPVKMATEKTKEKVKGVGGFLKTVGQETARNIGSAAVTLTKEPAKQLFGVEPDEVVMPKSLQGIFRDEPIKSIELRIAEAEMKVKEWGEKNKKSPEKIGDIPTSYRNTFIDLAKKYPTELAGLAVLGSVGIDLSPVGGLQKGGYKAMIKSKNVIDATKTLKKMGLVDDLAKFFAEDVVKITKEADAKKLLNHIAEVQRKTIPTNIVSGWNRIEPVKTKIEDLSNVAMRTKKDGTKIPAIRAKSGIYADKPFETYQFKDAGGLTDNITSWAATVDNIQEGKGFGPAYNLIHDLDTKSILPRNDYVSSVVVRVKNLAKDAGIKVDNKSGEIIYQILEGAKPSGANSGHYKVAKELRKMFDAMRIEANNVRKALGKPEMGYIEDYAPHLRKVSAWRDMWASPKTTITDVFDFVIPNQKTNPHAFKRTGALMDKETNIWKLVDGYSQSIANDIYITPGIEKLKAVASVFEGRDMLKNKKFLDQFIRNNLVGKPNVVDNFAGLTAGSVPRKLATNIIKARTLGALAANIQWVLFTQPASMALTLMKTGPISVLRGAGMWATKAGRAKLNILPVMRQKSKFGISRTAAGDVDKSVRNIYRGKIDTFNDFIGRLGDAFEYNLTGMSSAAGYKAGGRYGLKGKDLDMYADYIGRVTQSQYTPEMRTQLLNSAFIRLSAPFQTFSTEFYRHIKTLVGKGGGLPLDKRQRLGHAINLVMGTVAVNYVHEKVKGRPLQTPGSAIPLLGSFVDEQLGKISSTVLTTAEQKKIGRLLGIDTRSGAGVGRAPIAPLEDIKKISTAVTDVVKYGNFKKFRQQLIFWGMGLRGLGGAAQTNRIIDGLIAAEKGFVEDVTGKKLYNLYGWEKLWGVIVGPGSTPSGIEHFRPKDPKPKKISW